MPFQDLRDFLDEGLDLPIGGVTYHVAPPPAAVGLRLQLLRDLVSMGEAGVELKEEDKRLLSIPDNKEIDFYRDSLGAAYDEMVKKCTAAEIRIAAGAAFICWTSEGDGRAEAELYWTDQMDPRKAAASPMTEPTSTTPVARGSAVMAAASTTKRPNSGSGTSFRPATKSKRRAAARA